MPPKLTAVLRTLCVTTAFGFVAIAAAAEKNALVGLTRDQVIAELGEVKSLINAGSREVLFFEKDRVTLRNGVVIEVDLIPPPRPAPPPPPPVVVPAPEAVVDPAVAAPTAAAATAPLAQQPAPVAGAAVAPRLPGVIDPTAAPLQPSAPLPPPVPEGPAPLLVRPLPARPIPSAAPATAITPASVGEASSTPPAVEPAPTIEAAPPPAAAEAPPAPATVAEAAPGTPPATENATAVVPVEAAVNANAPAAAVAVAEAPVAPAPAPEKNETPPPAAAPTEGQKKIVRRPISDAEYVDPTASLFNVKNFAILGALILGGIGYMFWRGRQRSIALASTTVSSTPFSAPPIPPQAGVKFDAAFLAKLDWRSFETLVAAYYSKTGVVATRTPGGPESPVHVKISWMGEARPFAYVQCIAQPPGLVQAAPVEALFRMLTADEIRRGYVVTTGKFGVPARDFAEEKHITLLSGDMFLEKLNALPDLARNEIMAAINASDPAVPAVRSAT